MEKKKTNSNVKRATKKDDEQIALDFLQNKTLELYNTIKGLQNVEYKDGKIVLYVEKDLDQVPDITHEGVKLDAEVVVNSKKQEDLPKVIKDDNLENFKKRHPILTEGQYIPSNEEEGLNHFTGKPKDLEAYEKWKQRNKSVKIGD